VSEWEWRLRVTVRNDQFRLMVITVRKSALSLINYKIVHYTVLSNSQLSVTV